MAPPKKRPEFLSPKGFDALVFSVFTASMQFCGFHVFACVMPLFNKLGFDTFDETVKENPDAHPLFHSDRGFQYTSKTFRAKLDAAKMVQSMSRVGRCIDNGPMEGFWGTLKSEMYYLRKFSDKQELISAIENYIHF